MITAAQLRAARGLLDWTRSDLAKAANISPETIKNIEHGTFRPQETTADAIVRAFGAHDVVFTDNDGVQKKKELVRTYEGDEEFKLFLDDMYEVAKAGNAKICTLGVEDALFVKHLGKYSETHISRMSSLNAEKVRCIVREGDGDLYCSSYNEYRSVAANSFSATPFYIYGNRFAVVIFGNNQVTVVSILSQLVADAYRKQFDVMWNEADEVGKKNSKKIITNG